MDLSAKADSLLSHRYFDQVFALSTGILSAMTTQDLTMIIMKLKNLTNKLEVLLDQENSKK